MDKFLITLFFGWAGVHKFMDKKIGIGLLYLFTFGLFGIGWIVDIVIAVIDLNAQQKQQANYKYINSLYSDIDQQIIGNSAVRPYIDKYYKGVEEIETMWSVMYNLKIISGEQADIFIQKCYENLSDLQNMLQVEKKYKYGGDTPLKVPAYVRLAMLYEKQEKYEEAINICVEAIKLGAVNDGNKGKMYGRLARLIKKSGINVSDDVLALSLKTQ